VKVIRVFRRVRAHLMMANKNPSQRSPRFRQDKQGQVQGIENQDNKAQRSQMIKSLKKLCSLKKKRRAMPTNHR